MLFFSYFKDLVGREVTVELKNDLAIRGTLHSVDQYLNIKLENTRVVDQDKYPHMVSDVDIGVLNFELRPGLSPFLYFDHNNSSSTKY
ncbi:U6 snRNA-associated Sm-like protein LSm2 [Vigna unguiculata]|uniref:U6 snRNA-associated Sm-like protein LSm2 n=1 Tax=Vigna unguiculata TaxID=3917 RepID=A0A4D6LKK0_VIGUN|nr:U6 snRNA-associated Sm-like protein LSm2 [Vigna unguiculata]